ncbi:MAG: hypothetical protein EOM37_00145 [Proteobacteria bacterium]|jgi:hypothetical protein|nr:hypothetical protein [Alphaproteobacteria bacterium]NCC02449.1 hypothetical protein [Pseudomonadota bacterium]
MNRNIHVDDSNCFLRYTSITYKNAFRRAVEETVKGHGFDPHDATKVDLNPMTHEFVYSVTLPQEHADVLVTIGREMIGKGCRGIRQVPACGTAKEMALT